MDGSIADATSLRMRHQLQRAYQGTTERPDQGFFEELMKLPVAPTAEKENDEPELEPDAVSDQLTSASSDEQFEPTESNIEDEDKTEEPMLKDNMIAACYAPLPYDPPKPNDAPPRDASAHIAVVDESRPIVVEAPPISNDLPRVEPAPIIPVDANVPAAALPHVQKIAATLTENPTADSVVEIPVAETPIEVEPSSLQLAEPVMERVQPPAIPVPKLEPARPNVEPTQPTQPTQRTSKTKPEQSRNLQPVAEPAPAISAPPANPSATEQVVVNQPRHEDTDQPVPQEVTAEKESSPLISQPKADKEVESSEGRDKWYMSDEDDSHLDAARDTAEKREQADDQSSTSAESRAFEPATAQEKEFETASQLASIQNGEAQLGGSSTQSIPGAAAAAAMESATSQSPRLSSGGKNAASSTTGSVSAAGGSGAWARRSTGEVDASASESDVRQLSQQERVRLVQRVARSFSRLGPEGGQVTLKLNPPELGVLNVSIRIEGQSMSAKLQTQTTAARDVILENLPVLRERLAEQGIEVEKFQVEVNGGDNTGSGQSPTSSGGESGGESRSNGTASTIDYRRLSRNSAVRPAVDRTSLLNLGNSFLPGRSLDIRA